MPDTSKAENSTYITDAGVAGLSPDASFFAPDFHNPRSLQYTASLNAKCSPTRPFQWTVFTTTLPIFRESET